MTAAALMLAAAGAAYASTAGSLDDEFAGGWVVNSNASQARACATQSDGKIVVAGGALLPTDDTGRGYVARYELDGTLHTTFGTGGLLSSPFGTYWTRWYPEDVAVDASDRIVVVGYVEKTQDVKVTSGKGSKKVTQTVTETVDRQIAVVRLQSSGELDHEFGEGGLVLTDVAGCDDEWANAVEILSGGGIVVGGAGTFTTEVAGTGKGKKGSETTTVSSRGAILLRYDAEGAPVATFGSGGVVIDDPNTDDGLGDGVARHALGVQAQTGRIVYLTHRRALRAVELEDGTLDDDFNTEAALTIATYGDVATQVLIDRLAINDLDGEAVILTGAMRNATDGSLDGLVIRLEWDASSATRYMLEGTEDTTFPAVRVDALGRIVVGANAGDALEEFFAVRLAFDAEDLTITPLLTFDRKMPGTASTQVVVRDLCLDGDDVVLTGNVSQTDQTIHWYVARYLGTDLDN